MLAFAAVRGTMAFHHDGCSPSIGTMAVTGNTRMNELTPFHAGDPWGFHIRKTKHCKHHIHVTGGMFNIKCDKLPIAATDFYGLSCGVPDFSLDFDIELRS